MGIKICFWLVWEIFLGFGVCCFWLVIMVVLVFFMWKEVWKLFSIWMWLFVEVIVLFFDVVVVFR